MPRKSIASLTVVRGGAPKDAPATPVQLAPVPDDLSPAEAKVWRTTVESKPADFFGPDAYPLLKELCRAAVMCDTLAKAVEEGARSKDLGKLRSMLNVRDREAKRMADIATKLRCTQQSRYTPGAAATADKRASGKRPWSPQG